MPIYATFILPDKLSKPYKRMFILGGPVAKASLITARSMFLEASKRLKGKFKGIFNQVVLLLAGQGVLSLKELYVNGTKIEANANRYTFVWGKSIKTSKDQIRKQLKEL